MDYYDISYHKKYNNYRIYFGHSIITLNFFELRILNQNLNIIKPLSNIKKTIEIKIGSIVIEFTSNQFLKFFNIFVGYYNSIIDEYKVKINSRLITT